MPTPRPASPATLSTKNAVATNALGVWLVDADADVPDLAGIQSNATKASLTFSTAKLGGEFAPSIAGGLAQCHPTAAAINSFPVVMGSIFYRATGSIAAEETIFALGDSSDTSGIFSLLAIDDGGIFTSGHVIGRFRTISGGLVGDVDCGAHTPDALQAAVVILYEAAGVRKVAGFLNGTKAFDGNPASDPGAFSTNTENYADAFSLVRSGSSIFNAPTNMYSALWWFSQTKLSDSDYTAWTGDPWIILQQPNTVVLGKGRAIL